jgi:hypothetical protein
VLDFHQFKFTPSRFHYVRVCPYAAVADGAPAIQAAAVRPRWRATPVPHPPSGRLETAQSPSFTAALSLVSRRAPPANALRTAIPPAAVPPGARALLSLNRRRSLPISTAYAPARGSHTEGPNMTISFDPEVQPLAARQIVGRGLKAGHGALLGALFLFLLQAPVQILGAGSQAFWAKLSPPPGQHLDPEYGLLALAYGFGSCLLAVAVFFLFPLVLGGILGRVRDRLEPGRWPQARFGTYARVHYVRLLGSQGLMLLAGLVIMAPVMCMAIALAFEVMSLGSVAPNDAVPSPNPVELQRQLLSQTGMLTGIVISGLLMSAVTMAYWVANTIVVCDREHVFAAWRKALHFCRENLSAVVVVWLLAFAAGLVMAPLSMAGQLGFVTDLWALAGLAVVYAALLGYWGVLMAGLIASLYLGRGAPAEQREPALSAHARLMHR